MKIIGKTEQELALSPARPEILKVLYFGLVRMFYYHFEGYASIFIPAEKKIFTLQSWQG